VNAPLHLLNLATGCYLVATVAALFGIAVRRELPRALLSRILWAGAAVHMAAIITRTMMHGALAFTSLDEKLSAFALLLVVLFLLVQLRGPLVALGAIVSPIAFCLTLVAAAVYQGEVRPLPPELASAWRPAHIILAFLGDAVFALAFSASVLYLVQERRLKGRHGRGFLRNLPSLETLDRFNYACLVWGLILLTLGIVTGVIWAHHAWVAAASWSLDPTLVFSLVTWGIYVVLLQGRISAGWRGRRAATLTILGFVLIVLSAGLNALGLGEHGKAY